MVFMKPRLILFKKEVGRNFDNPKTEVHFVVVDSNLSNDYPLNFVCVLPLSERLYSGHSTFRKLFGEESIPLARKLLSKALSKESDYEIKLEIGKRLKKLNQEIAIRARISMLQKSI